jgi:hypothetical protein
MTTEANELVPVVPGGLPDDEKFENLLKDSEVDFDYAKRTAIDSLKIAVEAVDELKDIALASQDAKAYDALGRFLQVIANSSKTLMELHEKRRTLAKPNPNAPPTTINNNLLISSGELLKQILAGKEPSLPIIDTTAD